MKTKIVMLCPHNAAKSVYAAQQLGTTAAEAGHDLEISTGGTHPDDEVLPIVRAQLEAQGHTVDHQPRVIPAEALDAADIIINIGCDHAELATANTITDWDIPNFSDDPAIAFTALDDHVAALLASLGSAD